MPNHATELVPQQAALVDSESRDTDVMSVLERKQDDTANETSIANRRGAIAHSERIPPEILAEILVAAAAGDILHFPPIFSSPHWVVSRTCLRWRNVALGEPRLWNRISVTSADTLQASRIVAFASKMLATHGPLSILLNDYAYDSSFSAVAVDTLVIPHLPRLKELRLNLSASGYPQLFQQPEESFLLLETLDLQFGISVANDSIVQAAQTSGIFNMIHDLRNLRLVSSSSYASAALSAAVLNLPVPWHQLKSLDIRLSHVDKFTVYSILLHCADLEEFTAIVVDERSLTEYDDTIQNLTLPHLTKLSLLDNTCRTLRHLVLPTLTQLHLRGLYSPSVYKEISDLIDRSHCKLLIFDGDGRVPGDATAMNNLMSHLDAAQEFKGNGLFLEGSTIRMIGRGELLPTAEILHCDLDKPGAFVDALEMRLKKADGGQAAGVVPFRRAVAQCSRRSCSEEDMDEATARLNKLDNHEYSLRWKIGPTRPLY